MADILILNSDTVESGGEAIQSLGSKVDTLSGTVGSLPTDTSEAKTVGDAPQFNVPVAEAVKATSDNIKVLAVRFKNAGMYMHNVADNHDRLQVKLKFKDLLPKEEDPGDGGDDNPRNKVPTTPGGGIVGGDNSGGGGGGGSNGATGKKTKKKDGEELDIELTEVGYFYPNFDVMADDSKQLFEQIDYDESGYARYGDRFIVACDHSIAEVGDVLRFTQKTGEVIECVVGIQTHGTNYQNMLNFIIDTNKTEGVVPNKVSSTILYNNLDMNNIGSVNKAGSYTLPPDEQICPTITLPDAIGTYV